MKTYILTENERSLIEAYLEKGTTSAQLRNLKKRAKESHEQLTDDLRLIYKFLMDMGVFVSEEYTSLEILEEQRRDQEARNK